MPHPYVLVGHSLGGTTIRLNATRYRGEVAALVGVDPAFLDLLPMNLPFLTREPAGPEQMDFVHSLELVANAGPLPAVPFLVLSAGFHESYVR